MNGNRRFIMRQRARVNPRRRLDAIARDELTVTYRCRTCGAEAKTTYGNLFAARMYARYHSADNGGCGGECKPCTKAARDELYPLPEALPYERIARMVGAMTPANAYRLALALQRDPRGHVVALHEWTVEKVGAWSQGIDNAYAEAQRKKLAKLTVAERRAIAEEGEDR